MVTLWQHNPIDVEIALRTAPYEPPFPPIDDRPAWEGLRSRVDAGEVASRIERIPAVDLADGPTDLARVIFSLAAPVQEVTVRLILTPLPVSGEDNAG